MTEAALTEFDSLYIDPLIAARPAEPRDSSRLIIINRAGKNTEHKVFSDLPDLTFLQRFAQGVEKRCILLKLLMNSCALPAMNSNQQEKLKCRFMILQQINRNFPTESFGQ